MLITARNIDKHSEIMLPAKKSSANEKILWKKKKCYGDRRYLIKQITNQPSIIILYLIYQEILNHSFNVYNKPMPNSP